MSQSTLHTCHFPGFYTPVVGLVGSGDCSVLFCLLLVVGGGYSAEPKAIGTQALPLSSVPSSGLQGLTISQPSSACSPPQPMWPHPLLGSSKGFPEHKPRRAKVTGVDLWSSSAVNATRTLGLLTDKGQAIAFGDNHAQLRQSMSAFYLMCENERQSSKSKVTRTRRP